MKKSHLWLPSDSQMTIHDDCLMMVWQLPSTAWWLLMTVNDCLTIDWIARRLSDYWTQWLSDTSLMMASNYNYRLMRLVAAITSIKMQNETHHMRHRNRKLPWWRLVWRCQIRTFWKLQLRVNNKTDKFKVWEEARHRSNFIPCGCHDLTR